MKTIGRTASGNDLIEAAPGFATAIGDVLTHLNAVMTALGTLKAGGNDSTVPPPPLPTRIGPVIRPKAKPAAVIKPAAGIKRTCSECGKSFALAHGNQKTCSAACSTAREKRREGEASARIAATRHAPRTCISCGQQFTPRRIDQTACNRACRHKHESAKRYAPKPPERPLPPTGAIDKATRLEMIRRAAKRVLPPPAPSDNSYVNPENDQD